MKRLVALVFTPLIVALIAAACAGGGEELLPAPTATPTSTPSPTPTSASIATPAPTPTPSPTATAPSKIEVTWEKIVVPGVIAGLSVENGGNLLYTLEPILVPPWVIFRKSEDGGKTWQEIEKAMIPQNSIFTSGWWETPTFTPADLDGISPDLREKFKIKLESIYSFPYKLLYHRFAIDQNNKSNILGVRINLIPVETEASEKESFKSEVRVFLSLDGNQTWIEINAPPPPKGPGVPLALAIDSSDKYLMVYLAYPLYEQGISVMWQTTFPLENLPN